MADDPWKRFRERQLKKVDTTPDTDTGFLHRMRENPQQSMDVEQLAVFIKQVDPMIEQLNSLYHQYMTGIEKRPPLERRKKLDELMQQLQDIHKPTMNARFRANVVLSRYHAFCERWDKILRAMERAGKIGRSSR